MKKVLMLSVGRQTYLVNQFAKYFDVVIGDNNPLTTALYSDCKTYIMPRYEAEDYAKRLIDIISSDKIDYLLSLSDVEIALVAGLKNELPQSCELLMPDRELSYVCLDKWAFSKLFNNNAIDCPKTYLTPREVKTDIESGRLSYPIIGKSRWGMGSKGVLFLSSAEELDLFYKLYKHKFSAPEFLGMDMERPEETLVFQEVVGGVEYGLDIVNDLNGNWYATAIKKKLLMRGGETDIAEVVSNNRIEEVSKNISKLIKYKGNIDCDLIMLGDRAYVIDVNPRFGGGYIFSLASGLDVPCLLHSWTKGEMVRDFGIKEGHKYRKITSLAEIQ